MVRKEYTMSQEQRNSLLDACKPVPLMYLSGGVPMGPSPQENANAAWRKLGEEMSFKWDTVRPLPGSCDKHFSAEPKSKDAEPCTKS